MVIGMSVCILCLYVHPLVYHRNHMSDLTIFSVHVACGYIISNGNTCTLCISRVVTDVCTLWPSTGNDNGSYVQSDSPGGGTENSVYHRLTEALFSPSSTLEL